MTVWVTVWIEQVSPASERSQFGLIVDVRASRHTVALGSDGGNESSDSEELHFD